MVFRILFILATLIHQYSAGSSFCGEHDGYTEYMWDGSSDYSEITNTTLFQLNLDKAFSLLTTNKAGINLYRWAAIYSGVDANAAYTSARCIGYLDYDTCLNCIEGASAMIKNDCFGKANSSIIWYGDRQCMVQYSNHNTINKVTMPDQMVFVQNDTQDVSLGAEAFNGARTELFNVLAIKAKDRLDGYQKLSLGKWYVGSSNETIYGVSQCSPGLSFQDCSHCLDTLNQKLENYFYGKVGGGIVGPSCNVQYQNYNFFGNSSLVVPILSPPSPPPPPPPPSSLQPVAFDSHVSPPISKAKGEGTNKARLGIYIVAPIVTIGIILFVSIYVFLRKKKNKKPTQQVEIVGKNSDEDDSISEPDMKTEETLQYEFSKIRAATENFSTANKLGQGGFGAVYKGKLPSGKEIAVKRLSETSRQGEVEFKNEVMLLANLQHKNLVRLLGFCLKRKERLLIYELVANSSLDNFIFDPVKRARLGWDRLYKIIGGVARGLLYLHEDSRIRIIHRDLKSSNILLDNELTPKIADFGMARLFPNDETQGSTSKIVGTYGYMAPEYLMHGHISTKSDVFSFGVLLLEIVCGRRNNFSQVGNNVENLLSYAWKNWHEGTVLNLIGPALKLDTSSTDDMTRCIHIGLLCAQEDVTQRPTMASVVNMLVNPSIALLIPSKPFFQQRSNINQETPLLDDYDSRMTSNSSGSKNKSSNSWTTTDTELYPR